MAEYHGFPYNRETGDRENDNPLAFTSLSDFQLLAEQYPGEFWTSRQDLRVHDEEVYRTLMEVAGDKAKEIGVAPIAIPGRLLQDDIVFDSQSRSSWAPGVGFNMLPNGTSASPKKQPPPLFKNKS